MHKLLFIITLFLTECTFSADYHNTIHDVSNVPDNLPYEISVVEFSSNGYFIRLASSLPLRISSVIEVADSLAGKFERIDFCTDTDHERGDEYLSVINGIIFDYRSDNIYTLN